MNPRVSGRPCVRGKFLYVNQQKLYLRGVTYGPFRPDALGCEYHTPAQVKRDFRQMAGCGINAVRVYTMPPTWLLDAAAQCNLYVMVGLPWEQHVTFLDNPRSRDDIEQRVREMVRTCANHPALLCYAIGNEIPAPIVRWYGRQRIERFLHRLYQAVKQEDPSALVSYVNYPTTEYLQLPFVDFHCFNVYLEQRDKLEAYLRRLHNLVGDKPLVMGEVGLDSLRHGDQHQAHVLEWQIRSIFASGCAGMFVFSWTDEWHRGGVDIDDWCFGLTDRQREPKPALQTVQRAYGQVPFPDDLDWPRVSVVVCTYNGSRTIAQTLDALKALPYPNFEVIVVNDGSTDSTPQLLEHYRDFQVINTENFGLSHARNVGWKAARGSIIAYLDDDACPDTHWLHYLAWTFMTSNHVGVGGPNLPPEDDPRTAHCVACSPGGPNHVLLSDDVAEHIPGCNMAIRRKALDHIGGFDEQFRIAGDDVDVCWRLQERDGTLGFHPAALVWHRRRHQVKGYLRQQKNYGRAEAMLEMKWPQKYNAMGHVTWGGRVYGSGMTLPLALRRWRIYHGVWCSEPFQSMYANPMGLYRSLPLMPEWYLLIVLLMLVAAPGVLWRPLLLALPLLVLAMGIPLLQASLSALHAPLPKSSTTWRQRLRDRALIAWLHLAQPVVRLFGRLQQGLSPWRLPIKLTPTRQLAVPLPRRHAIWCEQWRSLQDRLASLELALHRLGARTVRGGPFDRWDLFVKGGLFSGVRVLMTVEEHGQGKQLVRMRAVPRMSPFMRLLIGGFVGLTIVAAWFGSFGTAIILGAITALLLTRTIFDCALACGCYRQAIEPIED